MLRQTVRRHISEHPLLYGPIARRKTAGPGPKFVGPDTEAVIDGYMRSANTFAVYAFQLAQLRPVRLAHHIHAPAQLMAAARRNIPNVTLIRSPDDAVVSWVIWDPTVQLDAALKTYCRFYQRLTPYLSRTVVATFEQVTSDFGSVTQRLNERFDTQFECFQHTPENVRQVFALIEERARRRPLGRALGLFATGSISRKELFRLLEEGSSSAGNAEQSVSERHAPRPSSAREPLKQEVRERLESSRLRSLRSEAKRVYERYTSGLSLPD